MKKRIVYPLIGFAAIFILHAFYLFLRNVKISRKWVEIGQPAFVSLYLERQDYLLGLSYALAGAFTVYAFLKFLQSRRNGRVAVLGGITLTSVLYFAGCFLSGCCGSPMIAVYLSLFGSSFLGFAKPLTLILTTASVVLGYLWMERKGKTKKSCCAESEKCGAENSMSISNSLEKVKTELKEGIGLSKCRKCGCMKGALENLRAAIALLQSEEAPDLLKNIEVWLNQVETIQYDCLGCKHCFPAAAVNALNQVSPAAMGNHLSGCDFEVRKQTWPSVPGEYFAFPEDRNCSVAVSTLASPELAEELARIKPKELCIVGKTETENIGIDKVIKNVITNPGIRFLLIAGEEPEGHRPGSTFLSLGQNGIDEHMRVVGSAGRHPILKNVTREEVEAFRKQVQIIDMIGCENAERIVEKLKELCSEFCASCSCKECNENIRPIPAATVTTIQATRFAKAQLDKTGYFVIIPQPEKDIITAEHYSYDNKLLRVIEGKNARDIYFTIIENKWVILLSHAAYLGKELEKADLSIKLGFKYIQDGA